MFLFRLATPADLDSIMQILTQAQELLRLRGVDQWQDGYPTVEVVEADIAHNHGFVMVAEQSIAAYGALIIGEESAYTTLSNGEWLSQLEYMTLHRLAVSREFGGAGVGAKFIEAMHNEARRCNITSLRADTHRDNLIMLQLLQRSGFKLCGDVYLREAHRFAFEKLLPSL